jgi:hypothetical protein
MRPKVLALTIVEHITANRLCIADIMAAAGVSQRNVRFNTALHRAQEEIRRRTGHQVVERSGYLVVLDRDATQLHDAMLKSKQADRKRVRAHDIAKRVDASKLESADVRRRERFLDREEARIAFGQFGQEKIARALDAAAQPPRKAKRERRPKDMPDVGATAEPVGAQSVISD